MQKDSDQVAIIGMSCRFPGGANNPEALWELCAAGLNTWSPWPKERLKEQSFYHPRSEGVGTCHSQGGHFLEQDVSLFDAAFFNMTSDVAKAMDPQIRLLLEMAFEAFDSAGLALDVIAGSSTSVFAGAIFRDYYDMLLKDSDNLPRYLFSGNDSTMVANRISHFFDLRGPSVTVNTACSTATTALCLAYQSLRNGDATIALVGASNLMLNSSTSVGLSTLGLTGPDGKCYSFDDRAQGYGRGEGVSCVILKPLSAALRDGDPIRAVIRDAAMNQDGYTPTITSPSQQAQEDLIRTAYARASLDPKDTAFVEAHGTGTTAGDFTELNAIANVFCRDRAGSNPLSIGSVKANIGHTESTSGLAAVVKAVMMLHHDKLPPQALFQVPNRTVDWDRLKLKVQTEIVPWPHDKLRRISINNFGAGGTNTHIILESAEYHRSHIGCNNGNINGKGPSSDQVAESLSHGMLVPVSTKHQQGLRHQMERLADFLQQDKPSESALHFTDIVFTLCQRRSHFSSRVATYAESIDELASALRSNSTTAAATASPSQTNMKPKIAFIFTGQGAQWIGMGRELMHVYPVFLESIQASDAHIKTLGATWSILDELSKNEENSRINEPFLSFPLTVVLQLALVNLLTSWNICCDAIASHSSGEIAASYAAGALTLQEAVEVAYYRGRLTSEAVTSGSLGGGMTTLAVSEADAAELIRQLELTDIFVACQNSPSSVTLSGDVRALEAIEAHGTQHQILSRRMRVSAAYHSPHMNTLTDDYKRDLDRTFKEQNGGEFRDKKKQKLSCRKLLIASPVSGTLIDSLQTLRSPTHWLENMLQPVRFSDALTNLVKESESHGGLDIVIELGPHGALQVPMRQTLKNGDRLVKGKNIPITSCLQRNKDPVRSLLDVAGKVYTLGQDVDFSAINFPRGVPCPKPRVLHELPTYSWQHPIKYWRQPIQSSEVSHREFAKHDLLGLRIPSLNPDCCVWRNIIRVTDLPWLHDHALHADILFPISGLMVMITEAMDQLLNTADTSRGDYLLHDVDLFNGVVITNDEDGLEVQLTIRDPNPRLLDSGSYKEFRIYSRPAEGGEWVGNCKGRVAWHNEETPQFMRSELGTTVATGTTATTTPVDIDDFYTYFQSVGPTLGKTFRNITSLAIGENLAIATVRSPDLVSMMPEPYRCDYLGYLSIIDSCFQVSWGSMSEEVMRSLGLSIPRFAKQVKIRRDKILVSQEGATPATTLPERGVVATLTNVSDRGFEVSLSLYVDQERKESPLVEIQGFMIQSLSRRQSNAEEHVDHTMVLREHWEPDVSMAAMFSDELEVATRSSGGTLIAREFLRLFLHKCPRARILQIGHVSAELMSAITEVVENRNGSSALTYDFVEFSLTPETQRLHGFLESCRHGKISSKILDYRDPQTSTEFKTAASSYDLAIAGHLQELCLERPSIVADIRCLLNSKGRVIFLDDSADSCSKWNSAFDANETVLSPQTALVRNGFRSGKLSDEGLTEIETPFEPPYQSRQESCQGSFVHIATCVDNSALNAGKPFGDIRLMQLPGAEEAPQSWLVALAIRLQQLSRGSVRLTETDGASQAESSAPACVIILGQSCPGFLAQMNLFNFTFLKKTLKSADTLLWVSRGAVCESASPEAALHVGLLRTLRIESGEKQFVSLDLDPSASTWDSCSIHDIYTILRNFASATPGQPRDFEFAQRGGSILIPRLSSCRGINSKYASMQGHDVTEPKPFLLQGSYQRMVQTSTGLIDNLVFRQDDALLESIPLGDNGVEIVPEVFGLNFRDVMVAIGQLNEDWMGFECAGRISKLGNTSQTTLCVGDRVCALIPSGHWANRVRVPAHCVVPIPEDMDMETAASIPMAFITAYHAIVSLASLEPNQSILIHAAAGGIGQAAVTVAQSIGAQVYATVGSSEKLQFLEQTYGIARDRIFYSRDSSFRDGILTATAGRGVDVVLNCLSGDLLRAGWDCVAPFGRFLELGKKDAQLDNFLNMKGFNNSVAYISMDTVQLALHRGDHVARAFGKVMQLLRQGKMVYKTPITKYGIGDIRKAFRLLQGGSHIGKIVVDARGDQLVPMNTVYQQLRLSRDASYLIIGGLSGVGLEIARWMAIRGAGRLVLVSRDVSRYDVTSSVLEIQSQGAEIVLRSCDVAVLDELQTLVRQFSSVSKPLRGVIQAAAVLENASWEAMTDSAWHSGLAPKVKGSQNLDAVTADVQLDFFIMLSSVTGIVGNYGQSNYTAGNTFQDALARHRVSKGLPAVSIDLGSVPTLGLAARSGIGSRLEKAGYRSLSGGEMLRIVELAIQNPYQGQLVTGLSTWADPGDISWRQEPRMACLWLAEEVMQDGQPNTQNNNNSHNHIKMLLKQQRPDERTETLARALTARLGEMLSVDGSQIDRAKPLASHGVDSLVAVELRTWLTLHITSNISVFDIFQSRSLDHLAKRISNKFGESL